MHPRCWPPFFFYLSSVSIARALHSLLSLYVLCIHLLSLEPHAAVDYLGVCLWTMLSVIIGATIDPLVMPLVYGALALPTCILPPVLLELAEFLTCLYITVWAITATTFGPTTIPYIPKSQRSLRSRWLHSWLQATNEAFDGIASFLDSYIKTSRPHRRRCATAPSGPARRSAAPRSRASTILALTTITLGIARANTHCDNAGHATANRAVFDSDSFDILVDGGATASISNDLSDFIVPPAKTKIRIKGFNGTSSNARVGTVKWTILDDSGKRHVLKISGTYYVPSCPLRLLSPQHYSQQRNDLRGTYSTNYGDHVLFVWHKSKYRITMPLSKASNVGILRSAPGSRVFSCFVDTEKPPKQPPPDIFACQVITDDEADAMEDEEDDHTSVSAAPTGSGGGSLPLSPPIPVEVNQRTDSEPNGTSQDDRPAVIPFDLDNEVPATNLDNDNGATSNLDATSELMRWHLRLGHIPFANLKLMAARKEIPARLANCRVPMCQSCSYGRATKRPWRTKGGASSIKTATKPGQCVSVDQLESPVAGFIGQNKGSFFTKRYRVATVFVDHFSRLSYIYLQESTNGEQTLAAKRSFEAYAASHGVRVLQYHADNGRFSENLFTQHCESNGQIVSLCGVHAHFQNGIAEKRIRDLTERARTSLLHAMHRWPSAVTINLWPYALRCVNDVYISTPHLKTGHSPLERFSDTAIRPKVLNFHPPFCPVYVLHNGIASGSGSKPNKWVRRSRAAVHLGKSPRHARSVALVLSLLTGYVSAQFHLKHDDLFETVRDLNALPQSKWQELALFTPEEMTGKRQVRPPLLPATQVETVQWQPDHSHMASGNMEAEGVQDGDLLQAVRELPHLPPELVDDQGDQGEAELPPPLPPEQGTTTRSGRASVPPQRLIEQIYAVFDDTDEVEDYELQKEADDPIAFAASADPDTLYYNQAMKADDAVEFQNAMVTEADAHTRGGHWEVFKREDVPKGQDILPSVWAFKRKRRIDTREVYKHKARLNIHGGKQTHGVNYWETYSPVVNWFSIRLCLTFSLIFDWHTR
jgi:hypothetical protein